MSSSDVFRSVVQEEKRRQEETILTILQASSLPPKQWLSTLIDTDRIGVDQSCVNRARVTRALLTCATPKRDGFVDGWVAKSLVPGFLTFKPTCAAYPSTLTREGMIL